jgi:hypothetical protein
MPAFLAEIVAGGIVGLVITVIFALLSGYNFGNGFATAALIVVGAELFTGRFAMLVGTIIAVWAAVVIALAIKGKMG